MLHLGFKDCALTHLQYIFRKDIDQQLPPPTDFDLDGGTLSEELSLHLSRPNIMLDAHAVASCKNMHRHTYTCKICGSTCSRFGCPWTLQATTTIDNEGTVEIGN